MLQPHLTAPHPHAHPRPQAFSKKCVDQRKEWLTNWMEECKRRRELGLPELYLYEKDTRTVNYTDFVNKELVLFSNLDNERSIPCLVDGLKPGQRKVSGVGVEGELQWGLGVGERGFCCVSWSWSGVERDDAHRRKKMFLFGGGGNQYDAVDAVHLSC